MSDKLISNMMPNMMFTNHIMNKFNSHHTSSNTTNIFTESFISETCGMFLQIFIVSFFAAFSAYCTTSMEYMKNIFTKTIRRFIYLIFFPFINFYYFFLKKIYGDRTKYKIIRTCSQYTTELIRNTELFEVIQWFINSNQCEKIKKNIMIEKSKEIYYQNSYNYINDFDDQNITNIKFGVSTTYGEDILIKFESYDIICIKDKQDIEIKGELQTEKRDNICYYFETQDIKPDSDIIERFFQKAIVNIINQRKNGNNKFFIIIWMNGKMVKIYLHHHL
jgi:putative component of membrane protein insertase Oxa1/YidC/SpoIIIJ protein YidD